MHFSRHFPHRFVICKVQENMAIENAAFNRPPEATRHQNLERWKKAPGKIFEPDESFLVDLWPSVALR